MGRGCQRHGTDPRAKTEQEEQRPLPSARPLLRDWRGRGQPPLGTAPRSCTKRLADTETFTDGTHLRAAGRRHPAGGARRHRRDPCTLSCQPARARDTAATLTRALTCRQHRRRRRHRRHRTTLPAAARLGRRRPEVPPPRPRSRRGARRDGPWRRAGWCCPRAAGLGMPAPALRPAGPRAAARWRTSP